MTPLINRLIVAAIGLTIIVGLAGCNSQPPEMTQDDFAKNRESLKKTAERNAQRR